MLTPPPSPWPRPQRAPLAPSSSLTLCPQILAASTAWDAELCPSPQPVPLELHSLHMVGKLPRQRVGVNMGSPPVSFLHGPVLCCLLSNAWKPWTDKLLSYFIVVYGGGTSLALFTPSCLKTDYWERKSSYHYWSRLTCSRMGASWPGGWCQCVLESKPLVGMERETHSKQIRKRGLYAKATGLAYNQAGRFNSRRAWT